MKEMKQKRPTCYNKHLQAKGEKPLSNVQWRQVVEKAYGERSRVKRFRELADEEKQAGIQGQWQQESPAREYLEQVRCCHDTDCNEPMMKKVFAALEKGTWER